MAKFRKKPIIVQATQIQEAWLVMTAHGQVQAEAGDWIVTDPVTGDTWPIKPDIFQATYEPVEE